MAVGILVFGFGNKCLLEVLCIAVLLFRHVGWLYVKGKVIFALQPFFSEF
jgi:hypothetical protein